SLINKISGLWSSKPTSNKPAPTQRSEPAIDEASNKEQIAISILDLSRPGDAAGPIGKATGAPLESSEDDLDIPAFLRRQAN
ncbi:MAG: cell division protein FtsZ, partial [Alphaproteobacteria bacterium]|nr:cell division protein FtsZ [Alphaproteobacteria bacterium]